MVSFHTQPSVHLLPNRIDLPFPFLSLSTDTFLTESQLHPIDVINLLQRLDRCTNPSSRIRQRWSDDRSHPMFGKCVCASHVAGSRDRKEDGSEIGNELRLEVLRGLDYFRTGGEEGVDLGRFGRVVHADVCVGDQPVV